MTTSAISEMERLRTQLRRLALPTIAQTFEEEATKAAKSELSYTAFLARLVDDELAAKLDRSVSIRLSKAGFPVLRTLETFDFSFQPALPAARLRELAELGFLGRAENVLFIGRPGVGKTHLATALAVRACHARKRVQFLHAPALLDQLLAAEVSRGLAKVLEGYGRLDLLVVDELGYLPMDNHRANLFFQLVSHLYTRTAVVVTSNVAFDGWGRIFGGDEMIAAAILDRLLHFSHVFLITGPSYRMKGKRTPGLDPAAPALDDTG
jgi:DNA replication protein DnaC